MPDSSTLAVYFEQAGPQNTQRTLELAKQRAEELGLRHVIVPSTTGSTGKAAVSLFRGLDVIVVTHSAGFAATNQQEMDGERAEAIRRAGGRILTCLHAFGGVSRAVRRKLGSYQLDEIIAFTLRCIAPGIKVACEITMMATDAGLVPAGDEVMALGGTGRGVDTAAVILAANAQDFFDLRVLEIVCKPRR